MISEHRFAMAYTSFWREITPMGDVYVRSQNLMLERYCEPLQSTGDAKNRSRINELAFRVFAQCTKLDKVPSVPDLADMAKDLVGEVTRYVQRFAAVTDGSEAAGSSREVEEAVILAIRLLDYFGGIRDRLVLQPRFAGCGVLEACEGDLIVRETLYEVKAGERNFRVADLRQLLIYCALNRARPVFKIVRIALINPRVGVYWADDLERVSRQVSGSSAPELLDNIVEFLAAPSLYA